MANPSDAGVTADELRAAAERLRQHESLAGPITLRAFEFLSDRLKADLIDAAQAYLAEYPADSHLPADEAWLRSVGMGVNGPGHRTNGVTLNVADHRGGGRGGWGVRFSVGDGYYVNGCELPNATRGTVRRLLAALGVELKESNP